MCVCVCACVKMAHCIDLGTLPRLKYCRKKQTKKNALVFLKRYILDTCTLSLILLLYYFIRFFYNVCCASKDDVSEQQHMTYSFLLDTQQ